MAINDEVKDTGYKLSKEKNYPAKSENEFFQEAQNIKENVVGLARSIIDSSADGVQAATDYVHNRMDDMKASGENTLNKIETSIQAKPAQSVAIAFIAGLLAS